jgi:MFS family permease
MSTVTGPAGARRRPRRPTNPLRSNRDFLLLWTGAGLSLLGSRVGSVAYPLLVLWHTGSASAAGLVGFATQLPQLLVQLPAGAFVDRWDRRRVMIASDLGRCLLVSSVAVAVVFGRVWVLHLMVVAFLEVSLTVFYRLAERAAVRNLVSAQELPTAMSQNEARGRAATLLGQPGGSLLFTATRWAPFAFTAVAHLASLVTLVMIRTPMQQPREPLRRNLRQEIGQGIAWVRRQSFLRAVMVLVAVTNVFFQGLSLALIVIIHDQGAAPWVVGLTLGVSGIGGALGALSATWWTRRVSLPAVLIGGLAAWTVLMPLVAVVREPVLLGILYAGMSYVGGLFNVTGGVYQVQITPDGLQARVNSVLTLIGSGANSLGMLAGGFLLGSAGVAGTALGIGAGMLMLLIGSLLSPTVRHGDPAVQERI